MNKSREMQQALDIVAGRTPPAPPGPAKWSGLERTGLVLWIGVAIMAAGLAGLYLLA